MRPRERDRERDAVLQVMRERFVDSGCEKSEVRRGKEKREIDRHNETEETKSQKNREERTSETGRCTLGVIIFSNSSGVRISIRAIIGVVLVSVSVIE